jgi:hypothetical protein
MLRYLTERLPIMTTPRWVNTLTQPIAVRDVLRYLVGAVALPDSVEGVFDIGGPDVLSYRAMMDTYAKVAGLRPRIIIPIPVLTPRLSSGWVGLVTPVPYQLARRLVASLKNEVIAHDSRIRDLIPDPEGGLTSCAGAITLALARIKDAHVDTRWSDASIPGAPSDPLPTDPDWAGGSIYTDVRTAVTDDSVETVWARVEAIGGDNGYSRGSWAWEIRGLIDRVFGGVGLRRGRRDPDAQVMAVDRLPLDDAIAVQVALAPQAARRADPRHHSLRRCAGIEAVAPGAGNFPQRRGQILFHQPVMEAI